MKKSSNSFEIYKARTIGSFFLLAFLAYGFGQHLFWSDNISQKYIGSFLILGNSIIVLLIGVLLKKTLQEYNLLVANIYLLTRLLEAIALGSVVLNLTNTIHIPQNTPYFIAMLVLGLGSIPMCLTLYNHKVVPSWLALWGIIGYGIFALGFLMELFGKEWSMYLLILGGLWELTFAVWLIIKHNKPKN